MSETPEEVANEATENAEAQADAPGGASLDLVIDVPLRLTVEVGTSKMLVRDVLQLSKGSVIELDRAAGDPVDVLVNGRLLARGELANDDERLTVRIVETLGDASRS